jgi:hypothetical protein
MHVDPDALSTPKSWAKTAASVKSIPEAPPTELWIVVPLSVLEQLYKIKPTGYAVYCVILSHCVSRTTCFLKVQTIAKEAGLCLSVTRTAIRKLEEVQLLKTRKQPGHHSYYTPKRYKPPRK